MIRFECDYTEGAHPRILEALIRTNMEQTKGYSEDEHCENARKLIREKCGSADADVHFLVGGTQTNMTVIAAALRPHQGVICAQSGHINVHETGAVEATGHKVLALPSEDGKITADQIKTVCDEHDHDEHMVQPGMVYISNPTENGTLYNKKELQAISEVCKEYGLPLFLDGARLGYGLAAQGNDITLPDLAQYCDVFYIGGTKVGALFGEAVVITREALKKDFRYFIKQKGGMLAKGRLLGIQFEELFRDDLYMEVSAHADRLAMKIRKAFVTTEQPKFVCFTAGMFLVNVCGERKEVLYRARQIAKSLARNQALTVGPTAIDFAEVLAARHIVDGSVAISPDGNETKYFKIFSQSGEITAVGAWLSLALLDDHLVCDVMGWRRKDIALRLLNESHHFAPKLAATTMDDVVSALRRTIDREQSSASLNGYRKP